MKSYIEKFYIGRTGSNDYKEIEFASCGLTLVRGDSDRGKTAVLKMLDHLFLASDASVPDQAVMANVDRCGAKLVFGSTTVFVVRWLSGENSDMAFVGEEFPPSLIPSGNELLKLSEAKSQLAKYVGFAGAIRLLPQGSRRTVGNVSFRNWSRFALKGVPNLIHGDAFFYRIHSNISNVWTMRESLPFLWGAYGPNWKLTSSKLSKFEELNASGSVDRAERKYALDRLDRVFVKLRTTVTGLGEEIFDEESIPDRLGGRFSDRRRQEYFGQLAGFLDQLRHKMAEMPAGAVVDVGRIDDDYRRIEESLKALTIQLNELRERRALASRDNRMYQDLIQYPARALARKERADRVLSGEDEQRSLECPTCGTHLSLGTGQFSDAMHSMRSVLSSIEAQARFAESAFDIVDQEYRQCLESVRHEERNRQIVENRLSEAVGLVESLYIVQRLRSDIADCQDALSYCFSLWEDNREKDVTLEGIESEELLLRAEIDERFKASKSIISAQAVDFHRRLAPDADPEVLGFLLDSRSLGLTLSVEKGNYISLERRGASQNSLWANVAMSLAMAVYASNDDVWLPSFLVLDQPSAVWYSSSDDPADYEGSEACKNFYRGLAEVAEQFQIQVIAFDHKVPVPEGIGIHIPESWFGGQGLVPGSWIVD